MSEATIIEIINAVADAKGVDPMDLDFQIHDYIDMDAIDQLLAHDRASWTLSFEVPESTVTVTSEGGVLVDGETDAGHPQR